MAARPSGSSSALNGKSVSRADVYIDPIHNTTVSGRSSASVKSTPSSDDHRLPHVATAAPETLEDASAMAEGKWRALAPLKERQKENRAVPQKWSDTSVRLPRSPDSWISR